MQLEFLRSTIYINMLECLHVCTCTFQSAADLLASMPLAQACTGLQGTWNLGFLCVIVIWDAIKPGAARRILRAYFWQNFSRFVAAVAG